MIKSDELGPYIDVRFKTEFTSAGIEDLINRIGASRNSDRAKWAYSIDYTISHELIRPDNKHARISGVLYKKDNSVLNSWEADKITWTDFDKDSPLAMAEQAAISILNEKFNIKPNSTN